MNGKTARAALAYEVLQSKQADWNRDIPAADPDAYLEAGRQRVGAILAAKVIRRKRKWMVAASVCSVIFLFAAFLAFNNEARAGFFAGVNGFFDFHGKPNADSTYYIKDVMPTDDLELESASSYKQYDIANMHVMLAKLAGGMQSAPYNGDEIEYSFEEQLQIGTAYCTIDKQGQYMATIWVGDVKLVVMATPTDPAVPITEEDFVNMLYSIDYK